MRKWTFLTVFALSLAALTVGFFTEAGEASAPAEAAKAESSTVVLSVEGVSCGSCEGHIRDALGKVGGAGDVAVDLIRRTVTVSYDPARTAPDALAKAVSGAGYPARVSYGAPVPAPKSGERAQALGSSCCGGKGCS